MALLSILEFPDPRLRTRAEPVRTFDAALERLVADMLETMYAAPGVGLAATQVNVHRQLFVMDTSEEKNSPQAYINARIIEQEGAEATEEGCLSVPNIFEPVKRATRVRVHAQDAKGQSFEQELTGLPAICVQHELDHLNGKLFVDYLSALKRERIRHRLEKERREHGNAAPAGAQASSHQAGSSQAGSQAGSRTRGARAI